jgi:hypothetical protein
MRNAAAVATRPEPSLKATDAASVIRIEFWRQRGQPRTTVVFDTYWRFAVERQALFFARLAGSAPPWTDDPILRAFKFTNAYRASDRTSQYLIRQVIYKGSQVPREVIFRTLLFKLFNRIETWEALRSAIGDISTAGFDPQLYGQVLTNLRIGGGRIYSGAYIMPAVPSGERRPKHVGHLALLARILQDQVPDRLAAAPSLRAVFEALAAVPSFGQFLAYQYAIDLNYGVAFTFEEDDFVVAGPGAREGLAKSFGERDGWSDEELIYWTVERQAREFERRGLQFQDLWGRPLKAIDCQNLYCEIAKYARAAHPSFTRPGGRSRIKQRFVARTDPVKPWYPPKWGLNDRVSAGNHQLTLAQIKP